MPDHDVALQLRRLAARLATREKSAAMLDEPEWVRLDYAKNCAFAALLLDGEHGVSIVSRPVIAVEVKPAEKEKKRTGGGAKKTPGPKCPTTGRRHKYGETHQCVCGAWERGHQPSAEARTLELPGAPAPLVHRYRDGKKEESRCGLPAASIHPQEITAYQAGTTCPECRA